MWGLIHSKGKKSPCDHTHCPQFKPNEYYSYNSVYLSYFDLSYVFPGHNDSVQWGLTVKPYLFNLWKNVSFCCKLLYRFSQSWKKKIKIRNSFTDWSCWLIDKKVQKHFLILKLFYTLNNKCCLVSLMKKHFCKRL